MNKQIQGSKKKMRKKAWLKRKKKREQAKDRQHGYDEIMKSGNIEDMARVMGIGLK